MNDNLLAIVKQIAAEYGEKVLAEPKRLKAFFDDLAQDAPKPLRLAFGRAVEEGAYNALKSAPDAAERALRKAAIAQRLRDEHGLDMALSGEALDILEAALFGEAKPPLLCAACGKALDAGWKACPFCGAAQDVEVEEQQAVPIRSVAPPEPALVNAPYQSISVAGASMPLAASAQPGSVPVDDLKQELLGRWNWKTLTIIAVGAWMAYLIAKSIFGYGGYNFRYLLCFMRIALPVILCGIYGARPACIMVIAYSIAVSIAWEGNNEVKYEWDDGFIRIISDSIFALFVCSALFLGLRPARGIIHGAKLAVYSAILFAGDIIRFFALSWLNKIFDRVYYMKFGNFYPDGIEHRGDATPYLAVVSLAIAIALAILWYIARRYRKQYGMD
jgi:hypothetical protein